MGKLFNQDNNNQQLIMVAMTNLITDEGYTTRQVFELVEEIKGNLWSALNEIEKETRLTKKEETV